MTGEDVLLELKRLRMQQQDPHVTARQMVAEAHEQLNKRRDELIRAGGRVEFYGVAGPVSFGFMCKLVIGDVVMAFSISEQSSTDAEAHALQNLVNAEFEARQEKKEQGK